MSRVNGHSRNNKVCQKWYISGIQASGVSQALWPPRMWHILATGKAAQGRRFMIMKGIWWVQQPQRVRQKPVAQVLQQKNNSIVYIYFLAVTLLALTFLIVGALLSSLVLHPWSMTILLLLLWASTTTITAHLWFSFSRGLHPQKRSQKARVVAQVRHQQVQTPFPATPMPAMPMPVPATPLVRVLETIDLSSTSVQHFLETGKPSEEKVPKSQMAMPIDEVMRHVDVHLNESTHE